VDSTSNALRPQSYTDGIELKTNCIFTNQYYVNHKLPTAIAAKNSEKSHWHFG